MTYDVVGFGEASIDDVWLLPGSFVLGDKGRARARHRLGGGQVATALVAAARLGARAAFLGPLGNDSVGQEIAQGLREEQVEISCTPYEGASRIALLLVSPEGDRTIVEHGLDQQLGAAPQLPATRVLHVDGTQPHAEALCHLAREGGALISVDLDLASKFAPALIAHADLCVLSEGIPKKWPAAVEQARQRGAFVVETLGARGLRYDGVIVPAFAIDVVDTTACGDTLRGALIVAWLEGLRGEDALRFASAAAALKCRDLGRRGCPTRADVDALLARAQAAVSTFERAGLPSK